MGLETILIKPTIIPLQVPNNSQIPHDHEPPKNKLSPRNKIYLKQHHQNNRMQPSTKKKLNTSLLIFPLRSI